MPILKVWNGSAWIEATGASGDVVGPGSSTDNAVTRFDSTTGKLVQNSGVLIDDSNNLTGVGSINSSAAKSFLITDSSGNVTALPPGNNQMMISSSTGFPTVVGASPNSFWANQSATLFLSVPLPDNTFAGRLSGDPAAISAASARTILGIEQVRKPANETLASSTTLQDDDDLVVSVLANTNYIVTAAFQIQTNATADWKHAFTWPAGATGMILYISGHTGTATIRRVGLLSTSGGSDTWATSSATEMIVFWGTLEVAGTAGSLQYQWAQNTSTANQIRVNEGSYLKVTAI